MKTSFFMLRSFLTILASWGLVYLGTSMTLGTFDFSQWEVNSDYPLFLVVSAMISVGVNALLEDF